MIEALLLWVIQRASEPDRDAAATAWEAAFDKANGKKPTRRKGDPASWDLVQFIGVARQLGAIRSETERAAELAKDYRHLIHPGRVLRHGASASRGKAELAVGAMDEVIAELPAYVARI